MAVEIPDLLIANVTPQTTEFMVVLGSYNFTIAKSFGFPVIGLPDGWHADYRYFFPLSTARRCELVISRSLPQSTATIELPLPEDLKRAKAMSADFGQNMRAVTALAVDKWARPRFRIANGGVLAVAQHRFRVTDPFAKEEYRKQFVELPKSDKDVLAFCKPPDQESRGPAGVPPKPTVASPFAFDLLSDEEKAAQIYNSTDWWATRSTPSAAAPSGFAPILVEGPPSQDDPNSWKGLPTESERESMRNDDWKKY